MTPTIEERIRRVRTALAEMGYPDVAVVADQGPFGPEVGIGPPLVPPAVCWTAWDRAGESCSCWACWATGDPEIRSLCGRYKECAHPEGPAKPPRELLVAR